MLKTPQATLCLMVLHLTAVHEPKVMDEEIFAPEASLTTAEVATMDQNLKQWVRTWDLEAEAELSHLEESAAYTFDKIVSIKEFPASCITQEFPVRLERQNNRKYLSDKMSSYCIKSALLHKPC
eukprot:scaffold12922_cov32-Tisochrysis_lutea.AAC.4